MNDFNIQDVTLAAGGRHRAFVALRLAGLTHKQIEALAGNRPGTVAYAITAMRKKLGVNGNEDKDLSVLAERAAIVAASV